MNIKYHQPFDSLDLDVLALKVKERNISKVAPKVIHEEGLEWNRNILVYFLGSGP